MWCTAAVSASMLLECDRDVLDRLPIIFHVVLLVGWLAYGKSMIQWNTPIAAEGLVLAWCARD